MRLSVTKKKPIVFYIGSWFFLRVVNHEFYSLLARLHGLKKSVIHGSV